MIAGQETAPQSETSIVGVYPHCQGLVHMHPVRLEFLMFSPHWRMINLKDLGFWVWPLMISNKSGSMRFENPPTSI